MATPEQKKRLLKAKIAVALHDELGRVPKTAQLTRCFCWLVSCIRQCWAYIINGNSRRKTASSLSSNPYVNRLRPRINHQTLDLQKDALQQAGCSKIFTDTASGAKAERTGLDEALNYIRQGDTLVVWRL